ncbi:MTRF1L release factor glutamine methyltransferase-like [Glossina fuscipes]|uniref:peptide chain release factor N(5)-glutamine methyltransferase n=1 Tax=Glossina fuscipes TaxID=7396 RepID=A0A8U0WFW5_9MUSC|nr:MTRF1L release factor glutamine methyltransferase-like [Glossina fuscipes]
MNYIKPFWSRFTRRFTKIQNKPTNSPQTKNAITHRLKEWNRKLKQAGVGDRETNIKYLMESAISKNLPSYDSIKELELSEKQLNRFEELFKMRCDRRPLQHIVGVWDFNGLPLKTNPAVFIPRPETEQFVSEVIRHYRNISNPIEMLEVGCGSGAISMAMLRSIPFIRSSTAIDCCDDAIQLAKENAIKLKLSDRFQAFKHMVKENDYLPSPLKGKTYDLIISNPPFARTDELSWLYPEVKCYENRIALDGGSDGLVVVRLVLHLSRFHLRSGGKLWLELGNDQTPLVKTIVNLKHAENLRFLNSYKDRYGRERFVEIEKT